MLKQTLKKSLIALLVSVSVVGCSSQFIPPAYPSSPIEQTNLPMNEQQKFDAEYVPYMDLPIGELKVLAEEGDVKAMSILSTRYIFEKNYTEGVKWAKKSAQRGDASGQVGLALLYLKGLGGLKRDDAKVVQLVQKAAKQNFPRALFMLGVAYYEGLGGLTPNKALAKKYVSEACEKGDQQACNAYTQLFKGE